MSLKAFHLIFIIASTALTAFLTIWSALSYTKTGSKSDLYYAVGSAVCGVALLVYGRFFLRKLKAVSYL